MKTAKIPIADEYGGYRCRFCDEKVDAKVKACPSCGIPWPPKEVVARRFLLMVAAWLVLIVPVGWLVGWVASFALPGLFTQVVGVLAGLIAGLCAGRYRAARAEVRMQTLAFLRTTPGAIDWRPSEIAAKLRTPAIRTVERALGEAKTLRQTGRGSS